MPLNSSAASCRTSFLWASCAFGIWFQTLPIPFALATEPRFYCEYVKMAESLAKIVKHHDSLFHDLTQSRVEVMTAELATLARGQVVFDATETWRTAYQRVLETLRVKSYYSVA